MGWWVEGKQGQERVVSEGLCSHRVVAKGLPEQMGWEAPKKVTETDSAHQWAGATKEEAWTSSVRQGGREARQPDVSTSVMPAPGRLRPEGPEFVAWIEYFTTKSEQWGQKDAPGWQLTIVYNGIQRLPLACRRQCRQSTQIHKI